MTVTLPPWAADLLHVWFERLGPEDWFSSSAGIDTLLREKFGTLPDAMQNRPDRDFLTTPDRALAAILLFDQIPRNIHRDTPRAFAFDDKAARLARAAIAAGLDRKLADEKRQFVAMPLMHSEDIADQEASLAYFGRHLPDNLAFARSHHEMIARFGRFPHRNAVLNRDTTPKEERAIAEGFSW